MCQTPPCHILWVASGLQWAAAFSSPQVRTIKGSGASPEWYTTVSLRVPPLPLELFPPIAFEVDDGSTTHSLVIPRYVRVASLNDSE